MGGCGGCVGHAAPRVTRFCTDFCYKVHFGVFRKQTGDTYFGRKGGACKSLAQDREGEGGGGAHSIQRTRSFLSDIKLRMHMLTASGVVGWTHSHHDSHMGIGITHHAQCGVHRDCGTELSEISDECALPHQHDRAHHARGTRRSAARTVGRGHTRARRHGAHRRRRGLQRCSAK